MSAVALIDADAHPAAPGFYRSFPFEPIGGGNEVRVDRVLEIRPMNLNVPNHGRVALATTGGAVGHSTFNLDALYRYRRITRVLG